MTPKTLRKERIQKFVTIICDSMVGRMAATYSIGRMDEGEWDREVLKLAAALADAAQSRTEITLQSIDAGLKNAPKVIKEVVVLADRKVDAIIAQAREYHAKEEAGQAWRGRELLAPQYHKYGDWWHKVTGLHMYGVKAKPKVNADYMKAFKEWDDNELTIESLQSAYDVENGWRKEKSGQPQNITTPSQLTAKAIAIQSMPVVASTRGKVSLDENGVPETY